jgi:outer membrane autotransporter protein
MKRIVIAAAAAFAMLGAAQAQTQTSPLYGELGYTFLKLKEEGTSTRNGAIRGIVGYAFHPNVAVEGMLGFAVNDDSERFVDPTIGAVDVKVKVQNSYGIFVKPKYAFNNNQFEVFGRLGWTRSKVKVTASAGGVSASASDSDNDFAYGAGVNFNINPRTYVGLDYMRYFSKEGTTIDGVTLGVGYRF